VRAPVSRYDVALLLQVVVDTRFRKYSVIEKKLQRISRKI